MEHDIPWRDMVAMLHRRRQLIFQILLAGFVVVLIGALARGPSYKATATVMVTTERARVSVSPDLATRPTVDPVTDEDLNSEAALLASDALVRSVLERHYKEDDPQHEEGILTRLVSFPFRLPGIIYRLTHGMSSPTPLDRWVESTQRRLDVTTVSKSNLIDVAYRDSDPEWAATFVNELVAGHIDRRAKLSMQSAAKVFFEGQRTLLAEKLRDAEGGLQAFYQREGVDSMPEQRAGLRARLGEMQANMSKSDTELAEANARVQFLAQEIQNHPKTIAAESRLAQNQAVQFIKPRLLELELQRTQLLTKYTPTSEVVGDINRQIAEAQRLLKTEKATIAETTNAVNPAHQALEVDLVKTKARVAAVQARVEQLRKQFEESRARMAHLDEIASGQERLEQEVAAAKEAYVTYSKKEEEARFSSALDESSIVNIAIAEPAEVPTTPENARTVMTIFLGILMSLIVGVAAAFVRDRIDPTVKSASEAHATTGWPVLAELHT